MDITVEKAIDTCRNVEKLLSTQLAANNVSHSQVEDTLVKLCAAATTALFHDFEAAIAQRAEDRIWDSHLKVNTYYRAALEKLRNSKEPTVVARRKLEGSYLRFIKNAQKFYRGYIRELAAIHGNVPELERAAKKVGGDSPAKADRPQHSVHRQKLLLSLHTTLIHLGDLSRYRESELAGKERNWGPAVGFYELALSVLPSSGIPHNQLAILALADNNLFRAAYQLYRALSAEEPHPQAEMNLRRTFYKISDAWKKNELSTIPTLTGGASLPKGLVAFFLRLLSTYYHGKAFSERDELEAEVISQLRVELKKEPAEAPPAKLVIVNIAAGHAAQDRLLKSEGSEDVIQSYLYFLRLNIRTFLALLLVLEDELKACETGRVNQQPLAGCVNLTMQRVLPVLRLYSSWLFKNISVLANDIDPSFAPLQAELWSAFARNLSLINAKFAPDRLPSPLVYMLDEDEDTIGFKALHCDENQYVWYNERGLRPKWHEMPTQQRNIGTEMLSRLRDLLTVGVALVVDNRAPLKFAAETPDFVYVPATTSEPHSSPGSVMMGQSNPIQTSVPSIDFKATNEVVQLSAARNEPQSLEDDFEAEANAMVDSLVGLEDDEEDFLRPGPMTPPSHNSPSPFNSGFQAGDDRLDIRGHAQSGHLSVSPGRVPTLSTVLGVGHNAVRPLHSPSTAQQAPRSPVAHAGSLGWGTPQQQQQFYQGKSRPGTVSQQTPLVPPGLDRHSRINSAEAIPSPWLQDNGLASPWVPDNTWSTFAPNDGQSTMRSNRQSLLDRNLGNGTFGEMFPRRDSQMGRAGSFRGSPVVGTGDGWGTPERAAFGPIASPFYERQMSFSAGPTTPVSTAIASIGSGRPKPIK